MSFAENLQKIRKEKHLSQEELAEILDVSRQAVSKWEQGTSYPEVDKLLILSRELNLSLDSLMATEIAQGQGKVDESDKVTGNIIISSPHEHVVVKCYKVMSSQKFAGGKKSPQYALYAVSSDGVSFWGASNTFLAWYATAEQLEKEITEIEDAIFSGIPTYELKYSVKVEKKFFNLKMVDA
ncbi:MAG: helix-turn-helix domain-containing protein [Blautia sp.]|nr:helix-turn-helix domain-containing protein [Lachnoclostridium sp.]MCM1210778.1 helix-turn-helix domain-containing protein [Blautia sp.]